MGRIRTIKPEFWRSEALSNLPEATHMLAAALLNYADDDGFFNANPRLIQAECCPLREPSVSIHDSLIHLSNIGYLQLGSGHDGRRYGHIVNFSTHQKINRPTPSKINSLDIVWDDSVRIHGTLTEYSLPEQGTGNREQGKEGIYTEPNGSVVKTEVLSSEDEDEIDIAFENWNITAETLGLPQAMKLTKRRRSQLRQRLKENGGLDGWNEALVAIQSSPFLLGQSASGWRADIDFLLQPSSFLKVIEGAYRLEKANGIR